jgi:Uma2 family endonuclease
MGEIMSSAAVQSHLTPDEYLALERKATIKSEYLNGQMYAMSGATRVHNLVCGNVFGELRNQLKESACEVYTNDMRVKVSSAGLYTYPDVLVVCDEPRFEDDSIDTLLNPTALFEILSPSTEAYDRGAKFGYYRQLDSMQEYTLVSQDCMRVEHYLRQGNQWILTEFSKPADIVHLTSINCELSLREIYAKVKFSPNDALHQTQESV